MRLFVPLERETYDKLRAVAASECRSPRDQASVLLAKALARVPRPGAPAPDGSGGGGGQVSETDGEGRADGCRD